MVTPRIPHLVHLTAVAALIATLGCGQKKRPVVPGFTPLDDANNATLPAADGTTTYPEKIALWSGPGHDTHGTYDRGDGQGYIAAPILTVWKALQDALVICDQRYDSNCFIQGPDSDATRTAGADESFILKCRTKGSTGAALDYTVAWRGRATKGTPEAPEEVTLRADLDMSAEVLGSAVMALLSDSIVLTQIDAHTTAYAAIRHRYDQASSPQECAQFIDDVFLRTVTFAHAPPDGGM